MSEDRPRYRQQAAPTHKATRRLYCPKCMALRQTDGQCPHCDLQLTNYFKYCRNCVDVHGSLQSCTSWRPLAARRS